MTIRTLPKIPAIGARGGLSSDIVPSALSRWQMEIRAADTDVENSISVLGEIGESFFSEGVTAKRIAGALRNIGPKDVTVNINSPGGDVFEGLAIYNLLREHKAKVTVKVLGIAASVASIIAMAGDEVQVPMAGFIMIHNTSVIAMGDRHDLREFADVMDGFDAVFADVYAARSGMEAKAIGKLMDKETWFSGKEAVEKGFADSLLSADQVDRDPKAVNDVQINAAAKIHALLAKGGASRNERSKLLNAFKSGTQNAADDTTRNAGVDQGLLAQLSAININ